MIHHAEGGGQHLLFAVNGIRKVFLEKCEAFDHILKLPHFEILQYDVIESPVRSVISIVQGTSPPSMYVLHDYLYKRQRRCLKWGNCSKTGDDHPGLMFMFRKKTRGINSFFIFQSINHT